MTGKTAQSLGKWEGGVEAVSRSIGHGRGAAKRLPGEKVKSMTDPLSKTAERTAKKRQQSIDRSKPVTTARRPE